MGSISWYLNEIVVCVTIVLSFLLRFWGWAFRTCVTRKFLCGFGYSVLLDELFCLDSVCWKNICMATSYGRLLVFYNRFSIVFCGEPALMAGKDQDKHPVTLQNCPVACTCTCRILFFFFLVCCCCRWWWWCSPFESNHHPHTGCKRWQWRSSRDRIDMVDQFLQPRRIYPVLCIIFHGIFPRPPWFRISTWRGGIVPRIHTGLGGPCVGLLSNGHRAHKHAARNLPGLCWCYTTI